MREALSWFPKETSQPTRASKECCSIQNYKSSSKKESEHRRCFSSQYLPTLPTLLSVNSSLILRLDELQTFSVKFSNEMNWLNISTQLRKRTFPVKKSTEAPCSQFVVTIKLICMYLCGRLNFKIKKKMPGRMIKTKWMLIIRTEAYLRVFPTVPFVTPRVSSELRCSTGMSLTEALPWTRITFVIGDGDRGCGGHENGGGIMISVKLIIMKIMTIYDDTQLPTIAIHCSAPSCVWRLPRWPSWPHSSWCQTLPRGQHRHHHSHNQESIHWSQTPIWKIIIMIIMILCRQCLAPLVRWTLFLARLASTILSTTRVGSWIMVPYIMT